ncbi:T9SS type A sorting domain-containing protein [bacterium SCSIO 12741]|nr:T9SS type A sorting domain-containing protein [bacterium SCSIO 12741]
MKKLFSYILFGSSLLPLSLSGQELIGTVASSTIDTNGYSISWTVGEIMTLTDTSGNFTFTQGLHQAGFTIVSIDRIGEPSAGQFRIYPNPFQHELNLVPQDFEEESFTATLTDMTGKVLHRFDLINDKNTLEFPPLADAQYLLLIRSESGRYQEHFKVIKSQ